MSSDAQQKTEFTRLRASLWPIHGHEMPKFLMMTAILFCVLYNYTVVRITKDVLITSAAGSGAEVLSYLKFFVVLPSSILFVVVYARMGQSLSKQAVYYTTLIAFMAFFALFAFVLYPNRDLLHPSLETLESLQLAYPRYRWIFPIYGYWTFALFYTFAELWGNVGTSILFWQFANEITPTSQSKRFYSMFGVLANLSLVAAGTTNKICAMLAKSFPGDDLYGSNLKFMAFFLIIAGGVILSVYSTMQRNILTLEVNSDPQKPKKPKVKISVGQSFKYLVSSRYLRLIAIIVLCYGMAQNLVEVTWKSQVAAAYPDPNEMSRFYGSFNQWLGYSTVTIMLLTKGIVRRYGWLAGAIITPLMIMLTGALFFTFILMNDTALAGYLLATLGTSPLVLAISIGALQNIFSKGTKYSLFDPTKEMAYIPLDEELRTNGKAAVDVIGGRLGKSGGGAIQLVLLWAIANSTQISLAPYLALFIGIIMVAWGTAVVSLSKEYNALIHRREREATSKITS